MFRHVGLSGPTYFAEIINTCIGISQSTPFNSDAQAYNVLLILTDGVVSDLRNTVSALVTASGLPLSVIIVGVGNASFEAMEVLDGDDEKLRDHQGRTCKRDIVQFVPFNKYHGNAAQLAAHTLDELPGQVCDYALMKRVVPLQPMEVEEMTFELTRGATMMPDGKRGGYTPQQAPPPPPPAHAAPSPWTSHVDASSGKTYYYNASTGVTQWEAPPGFGNTAPPPPVPSMNTLGQQGLAIFQQVINPSEPPPAFI
jgi:hypothetical protein